MEFPVLTLIDTAATLNFACLQLTKVEKFNKIIESMATT